MHRHTDEHLNHWADIYVARNVRKHGISLEAFLAYPHDMLARVDRLEGKAGADPEPHQHRCDRKAIATVRQRGNVLVQKLWHGSRRRNRADAPLPSRR
ncbi:MAG: hypothetical protein ACTHNM_17120 [Dyella sp.]|uniref:hypothetical protein n=1 Tax=Dyella sp. TaxID=1869338 RepID=UPI003F80EDAA